MRRRYLSIVVMLAACGLWLGFPQSRAGGQERPTLPQIIDGLEHAEKAFLESGSFLIRYERTKVQDVLPSKASGGYLLAEWTFARRADKWFSERRFTQPKVTKTILIPAKPKTQVVKETFILEWNQDSATAVVDEFASGRNIYAGLFYTRNLSLDAPKYIAKSNGANIETIREVPAYADDVALPFLPEFLRENKSHYTVLDAPEEVDGVRCWIVEWPGMDKFWVAPERGFAVPRRVYSWGPGKPRRFEFRHHNYREVKPGLWLPFTQNEDVYASIVAEKKQLWGKVTARCEYRVRTLEFDNVPNSLFDVKLPPGTRVIDRVRKFKYTTSGNGDADPFDAAIAAARLARRQRLLWYWAIGGVVFLGLLILGIGVYRLWGRRKKAAA